MRLHLVLLTILLSLCSAQAETTNTPPRALPVTAADLAKGNPSEATATATTPPAAAPVAPVAAPMPMAVPGGVNIHWYGHGFIYLTSSVGVRAAIDPFGANLVRYKFPIHLAADFVLITNESDDHSAGDMLFGNPLIFRSVTAVGLQRANGIQFHGIALQKDPNGQGGANTAFTLKFDGITFGYLGQINMPLLAQEKQELGHVDVLFLPVGLESLSVKDLNSIVEDLGARVIVPINYKTDLSGDLSLRTLDDYLSATKFPIHRVNSDEMVVTRDTLPTTPTIALLKSP